MERKDKDNFNLGFPFHIRECLLQQDNVSFDPDGIFQILHIQKGRFYYTYTNSPQQRIAVENSLVVIPPNIDSNMRCARETFLTQISCSPLFLKDIIAFINKYRMSPAINMDNILAMKKVTSYHLSRDLNLDVYNIFFEIMQEYIEKSTGYRLMIRMKFAEFLLLLSRLIIEGNPVEIIKSKRHKMLDIIHYIREHYYEEFHLEKLSHQAGLNPPYFCRAFKEEAGMPLFQFINHVRIQKACQILKRTDMPIIEIAYEVGYQNISFFNRCFKKFMQMSPRDYRHMIQK